MTGAAAGPWGDVLISGVGMTSFAHNADRSVLSLALQACRAAVADAGLEACDIDGIVNYSLYGDSVPSVAVAGGLATGELNYVMEFNLGGQAPAFMVMHAAMAISNGLADHVLVYRALKGRSGNRIGRHLDAGGGTDFRRFAGLTSYPQVIGSWIARYLHETASTDEDLGALVLAQREYAVRNPRALRRTQLTLDQYLAEPYITSPLRRHDCALEVDGAAAIVVSRASSAVELGRPRVGLRGGVWSSRHTDLDYGGSYLWPDYSECFAVNAAPRLWKQTGLRPSDIDVAEIYDCFSGLALMNLEGFGFCGRGEAGDFIRSGATRIDGRLPVNTHGGLLAEGYLHGMNTVIEGILQARGDAGANQVSDVERVLVCSGGRVAGSVIVLEANG